MNNENNTTRPETRYRPCLTFYHANAKGTGAAVQFELHPAHDDHDGSIMMRIANQASVGDTRSATPVYPRFDWKNAIPVKLDFSDLCKMLQVFRGETESIGEGKGLYHRTSRAQTKIQLCHRLEPVPGYSLEVYRVPNSGENETRSYIMLRPEEALGLSEAIAGSMSVISFGIPVVLPHDTRAYEAEQREYRNAVAA